METVTQPGVIASAGMGLLSGDWDELTTAKQAVIETGKEAETDTWKERMRDKRKILRVEGVGGLKEANWNHYWIAGAGMSGLNIFMLNVQVFVRVTMNTIQ